MNISQYVTFDLPIPYRNIKIYPIKIIDNLYFNYYSQVLLLEKNYISDVKIISMTNLEYIFHSTMTNMEKQPYLIWLDRLLSLCLKEDESFKELDKSIFRYKYDELGKPMFTIGEEVYTSVDYEEIRTIICEQNLVKLPDESISKEVRDSLEKAREYKNKLSGSAPGTLEDYLISLSVVTGWTLEYIYGLSIRKFVKSVRRLDNLIHYKIYLSASMSGMVEFKDKSFIKHWLSDIEENTGEYSDVSVDLNDIKDKVSMESAKK